MRFERIACVLSLAFACSFRAAKAEVATVYRRLLFEQFETVSEAEQFDAEEFYAQLSRQLRVASADPLLGDFSVQPYVRRVVVASDVRLSHNDGVYHGDIQDTDCNFVQMLYPLMGSSSDFENALETDAATTRFLRISPNVSVVVLEDLEVPTHTVNTIDCNGAAIDLRDSGLDKRHTVNLYDGIVIFPFQLSEGNGMDYQWFVQNSHMLVPCEVRDSFLPDLHEGLHCFHKRLPGHEGNLKECQSRYSTSVQHLFCDHLSAPVDDRAHNGFIVVLYENSGGSHAYLLKLCKEDSAASHLQLEILMGTNGVELLIINSTVRCLEKPHINSFVSYLLGPQGEEHNRSSGGDSATWIIIVAVSSAAAATTAVLCLCMCCVCFRGRFSRPLKLYTEDSHSFPPPPASVQQHVRIDAIRDSMSLKLSERGTESGPAGVSVHDPLQVHSHSTAHSGGATLHQRSCPLVVTSGRDCTCTPGSSSGPKSDSIQLEPDPAYVAHRVPVHSEDSHSPSGSMCASAQRFVGSQSQSGVIGPEASGRIRVDAALAPQEHDLYPLRVAEQHDSELLREYASVGNSVPTAGGHTDSCCTIHTSVLTTGSMNHAGHSSTAWRSSSAATGDRSDSFLAPRSHESTCRYQPHSRTTTDAPRPQTILNTATRSCQNGTITHDSIGSVSLPKEARLEEKQLQQLEKAAAQHALHSQSEAIPVHRAALEASSSSSTQRKSMGAIDRVPIVPSPQGLQVTTPVKSLSIQPQDVLHSLKSTIDADAPPGLASISPRSVLFSEEDPKRAKVFNIAQHTSELDTGEGITLLDLLPIPQSAEIDDETSGNVAHLEGLSKPLAMLQSAGHGALDSSDDYPAFPTMPTLRSFGEGTSEAGPTDILMDDAPHHCTGSNSDLQWYTCLPSPAMDIEPSSTFDGSISLTLEAR